MEVLDEELVADKATCNCRMGRNRLYEKAVSGAPQLGADGSRAIGGVAEQLEARVGPVFRDECDTARPVGVISAAVMMPVSGSRQRWAL
jgi:hypothetical protein